MTSRKYHHGNLKRALLDAAEVELNERGIERFSLRGVAKRAGVSHAAPSHHFGDVVGVMTALATLGFDRFCDVLEDRLRGADESRFSYHADPVINIGLGYIEFALAHPRLFVLMFTSDFPDFDNPELDASSMRSFVYLTDAVAASTQNKAPSDSKVNTAALAAWSTIHGISELLLHGRMRSVLSLPAKQQEEAIVQILTRAVS